MPVPDESAEGVWRAEGEALAAEVERVARRLRGLTAARLVRALPPYGTVADAGRRLAEALAEAGQAVEEGAEREPAWRALPDLAVEAVGDQVAVTGHDLAAALAVTAPDVRVRTRTGPVTVRDLVARTYALAHEIKLAID
ncbi:MAG: hypothetical protein GEV10_18100 [Streptosporangiales bacterium]|nr:hypothetical protein [Streptosporangiales bacterium]